MNENRLEAQLDSIYITLLSDSTGSSIKEEIYFALIKKISKERANIYAYSGDDLLYNQESSSERFLNTSEMIKFQAVFTLL